MRSNDTTMPSARGMHAPDRPVPVPRAVTGTPCSRGHARGSRRPRRRSPGRTTTAGRRGVDGQRLVVGVVVADRVAGEHVLRRRRSRRAAPRCPPSDSLPYRRAHLSSPIFPATRPTRPRRCRPAPARRGRPRRRARRARAPSGCRSRPARRRTRTPGCPATRRPPAPGPRRTSAARPTRCATWRRPSVVTSLIRSMASATSSSSGLASQGSLGVSSDGEISSRSPSGRK